ncbi:MAG TPA: hypothetical protein VFT75_16015 [Nocardioidaceae bacterium]|nr:hypothetical protein [Nocardioidaceae bacterium]
MAASGSDPSCIVVAGWIRPRSSYARSTCGRPRQSSGYVDVPAGPAHGSACANTGPVSR